MIAVRSNTLGGMSAGKWHLVRDRADHTALCGHENRTVGMFRSKLADNSVAWARENGYLCKRCVRKEKTA
jgi:hypothetical protein